MQSLQALIVLRTKLDHIQIQQFQTEKGQLFNQNSLANMLGQIFVLETR